VRTILAGLAARRFGIDPAAVTAQDGAMRAPDGRSATYGELLGGRQVHLRAHGTAAPRDPASHTVVGKSLARIDIPAKVAGGIAYVQDLRLPGMVHARVVRPPAQAARLLGIDVEGVARLPGVLKVVRDGRFLAVIADQEYRAVKAAAALARAARWELPAALPAQADPAALVRALSGQTDTILARGATVAGAGFKTLEASYTKPFQLHASIGPSCAIARLDAGKYTVWTHSQGVYPLRKALAELLGAKDEAIRCIHVEGSGCYGHNGADDVAADAALLARAFPGRPVRVQWMREDEHGWEPAGPPMLTQVRATLGAGRPHRRLAVHGAQPDPQHAPRQGRQPAGGDAPGRAVCAAAREAGAAARGRRRPQRDPLYTLPNARVDHHFLGVPQLRSSALRSLGAYHNVFSIESFMDELAHAAASDPVAFRLRHLDDPRAIGVVREAARRFGWDAGKRPGAGHQKRGRGFAFARYKNLAAYCAIALEVEVALETGFVRIVRAVAAVDCGEVVNPDGVRNQIEGGIIQSASWTCWSGCASIRARY
jgi:nicotinate dehydrogenase subunit B